MSPSGAILPHTLYTFALHLFVAGWPGLGLVLVPLLLFVSLAGSSGFVWLASRDPPLLLVFLVRRPRRVFAVSFSLARASLPLSSPAAWAKATSCLSSAVFLS